jgi:aryl-alcohol dehydrogenase-like predicted oxidoreductase
MAVTVTKAPRKLGGSTLSVLPIGLGCMSLSGTYGKSDDADAIRVVHHAIDRGINFLDSSDMYGWGHNETLLGKALVGRRDKVVLATKFSQTQQPGGANGVNGRPDYVKAACEASLKRLGVEVIDLYYQHRVDPTVPIEETVGAMGELVDAGKVRFLGLSEAAPETIRRAHDTHPISALQTEYSLWTRHVEEELLPLVRELGIGFVAYSPLGRGFLTGRFKSADALEDGDFRRQNARFSGENLDANVALVEKVEEIAAEKEVEPGQLALAWVHAQGEDVFPIPGTKRRSYLEQNAAAFEIELDEDDLARLDEAVPVGAAAGERYPSDP